MIYGRPPWNGSPTISTTCPHQFSCFYKRTLESDWLIKNVGLLMLWRIGNLRAWSVCSFSGEALCCLSSQRCIQNAEGNMSINVILKWPIPMGTYSLPKEPAELCKEGTNHSQWSDDLSHCVCCLVFVNLTQTQCLSATNSLTVPLPISYGAQLHSKYRTQVMAVERPQQLL